MHCILTSDKNVSVYRMRFRDRAFSVAAARSWNSLPPCRLGPPHHCRLFGGRGRPICFACHTTAERPCCYLNRLREPSFMLFYFFYVLKTVFNVYNMCKMPLQLQLQQGLVVNPLQTERWRITLLRRINNKSSSK